MNCQLISATTESLCVCAVSFLAAQRKNNIAAASTARDYAAARARVATKVLVDSYRLGRYNRESMGISLT
eukprot:6197555-Pleurochrysis_carterae.AAC.6